MRQTILAVCLLLLAGSAFGQSTTVTLNVTDTSSQAWFNGVYEFRLTPNPQYPNLGSYTWSGGTLQQSYTGTLNGSGVATPSIPSNTAITPGGSTWVIKVCPAATAACYFSVATTITGSTQTVSLTPPAIFITLINPPGSFTSAYADSEITSTPIGGSYFNLTTLQTRTCTAVTGTTCTTWASAGGSASGVSAVTGTAPIVSSGGATPSISAPILVNSPSPSSTYTFFMSSTSNCLTPVTSAGTTVCARNNLTSAIDFSGSDVATVWTSVATALATVGGHVFFKQHQGGYPANSATLETATGCSNFVGSGNALGYVLGIPANTPFSSSVEWTLEGEDAGVWQGEAGSTSSNIAGTYINVTSTAISSVAANSFIAGFFPRPVTNCTLTASNVSNAIHYKNIGIRFPTNTRGNEGGFVNWFASEVSHEGTTIADFALPYNTIATGSAPVAGTVGSFGFTSTVSTSGNTQLFFNTFSVGWRLCYDFQSEHIVVDTSTAIYCNDAAEFGRSGGGVYHPIKITHFSDQENLNGITFGPQMQFGSRVDFDAYDLELGASNWYARTTGAWTETNANYTSGIIKYSVVTANVGLTNLSSLFSSNGLGFRLYNSNTPASTGAGFPAFDSFTHPNGTLGPAWHVDSGAMAILSNLAHSTGGVAGWAHYQAVVSNSDQQATVTTTVAPGGEIGVGGRFTAAGGGSGYLCTENRGDNTVKLYNFSSGSFSVLKSVSNNWSSGDILQYRGVGAQQTCSVNGLVIAQASDSSHTFGYLWILDSNGVSNQGFANFSGGTLPSTNGVDSIYNTQSYWTLAQFFSTVGTVPVLVGALPAAASANAGQIKSVSDSTSVATEGQTCVGGSTNSALAFSNGTVWKCF